MDDEQLPQPEQVLQELFAAPKAEEDKPPEFEEVKPQTEQHIPVTDDLLSAKLQAYFESEEKKYQEGQEGYVKELLEPRVMNDPQFEEFITCIRDKARDVEHWPRVAKEVKDVQPAISYYGQKAALITLRLFGIALLNCPKARSFLLREHDKAMSHYNFLKQVKEALEKQTQTPPLAPQT